MKVFNSFIIIVLILTSIGAKSDEGDKIIRYFDSKEFYKQLYELGLYWDRNILKIQTNCKSEYSVKPIGYNFIKPLIFNSNDIWPIQGVWTFRFNFSRCDETITYNALFSARLDKQPQIGVLVPGTTRALPVLQRDLYLGGVAAMVGVKSKNKECKETRVLNTKVTIEPTEAKVKGVWEELWTVSHCGEKIDATFCLIPDGAGGTNWAASKCADLGINK